MRVNIYVEGPSDKSAMEVLLRPLIEHKNSQGFVINFFAAPIGHNKESLINIVPERAANTVLGYPNAIVIAVPDLYPKDKCFPHTNESELIDGITDRFKKSLSKKGIADDQRYKERFKVFCFKHDLEALILAAEDSLKSYLGISKFKLKWVKPVEEQDLNKPPKRIVENLFLNRGKDPYKDSTDAPAILAGADYHDIADKCPQCFKPFVDFLENLPNIG